MLLLWSWSFFIFEWMICIVMLIKVPQRRSPAPATAWLLIIFFLPLPGLLLYLLLGSYRLPKKRMQQHAQISEKIHNVEEEFRLSFPEVLQPDIEAALQPVVRLAEKLGQLPILGGNDAEFISETEILFARMVRDIDEAKYFVHLLFYIFADDETGRRVAEALIRAEARGVTCRVLVDAVGSRSMFKTLGPELARAGVEVCEMLPVGLFRRRMARMDLRNHRKLAVIDGQIGYTGSHNLINASYGRKDLIYHDLTMRMTGPIVLELQSVFSADWFFETDEMLPVDEVFPPPRITGAIAAQTLPSGPNYPTENYQRLVVAALHTARDQVIITTPYLVPDEAFIQAVQTAALRGVKVEIIVPKPADQILVGAASRAYYNDMLEAGANVYLYEKGLLHTKAMSIDHRFAFVGTSNFDIRSFALNFEINLVFYDAAVTRALLKKQGDYIAQSTPLIAEDWGKRPTLSKIFQNIAKLLSPVL